MSHTRLSGRNKADKVCGKLRFRKHYISFFLLFCFLLLRTPCLLILPVASEEHNMADTDTSTPSSGADMMTMPEGYSSLAEALPDDMAEVLPNGLLSDDPSEALKAVEDMTSLPAMLKVLGNCLGMRLGDAIRLLATLTGLILASSLLRHMKETLGGQSGEVFSFCLRLCIYTALVSMTFGLVHTVTEYFSQLTTLSAGIVPVMGTLYALGGNVTQAAVSQSLLVTFLAVLEYISSAITPPVCGICLCMTLFECLGTRLHTGAISGWIKKTYTSLLGFLMFLLSVALGAQTVLASRSDSLGMKGVKYAVSSMLPVVGGAISGTLGTVSVSIASLRTVCGVCGLILLALLLLPTLVQLLLFRSMISLSATVADVLDCPGESHLLSEIAGLYGYLAAAVSICSVVMILALGILCVGQTAI